MKNKLVLSICMLLFLVAFLLPYYVNATTVDQVYVKVSGNDKTGNGTMAKPFATIQKARDYVASKSKNMSKDIIVNIMGGTYFQKTPLTFGVKDSGKNGHKIIYKAYKNQKVIISGGIQLKKWNNYKGNIWMSPLNVSNVRSMYVNGVTAYQASKPNFFRGTYYDVEKDRSYEGMIVKKSSIRKYTNPSDIIIRWPIGWRDIQLPVTDIISYDIDHYAILLDPDAYNEAHGAALYMWKPTPSSKMYLMNAMEELDQEGEFYYNKKQKMIYYIPRTGEDLNKVNVMVPVLDGNVIDIKGTSTQQRVSNIAFDGLTVSNGNWEAPLKFGWYGVQAQDSVSILELCPPALISFEYAQNMSVQNSFFRDTASVGVRIFNDVQNLSFIGNVVEDIGDSAIVVGNVKHVYPEKGLNVCKNITIDNNLITRAGQLNWGMPGISAFYVDSLVVKNNDISEMPYSGISLGYGWSGHKDSTACKNNSILKNKIYNVVMKCSDGGGVYTLGQQPGSIIKGNYISNQKNEYSAIYLDEGTMNFKVEFNVCEDVPSWLYMKGDLNFAENNYSNTSKIFESIDPSGITNRKYDKAIIFTNAYPKAVKNIIDEAGLTGIYKNLTKYK